MANEIQIKIDPTDVERKIKKLENIKNGGPKAIMRAMNRTVTGMKTDAKKEITSRYTIKQKDIVDKLIVEKATMSELAIALRSKGRPVRSVKFHHTPNKDPGVKGAKPVSLKVEKGGRVKRLTGGNGRSSAFMATMPNGTEGIFQRNGEIVARTIRKGAFNPIQTRTGKSKSAHSGRVSTKVGRENIVQVSSPGVVQMLKNRKVRKAIQKRASERFNKELDHQVKYLLDQQKG